MAFNKVLLKSVRIAGESLRLRRVSIKPARDALDEGHGPGGQYRAVNREAIWSALFTNPVLNNAVQDVGIAFRLES